MPVAAETASAKSKDTHVDSHERAVVSNARQAGGIDRKQRVNAGHAGQKAEHTARGDRSTLSVSNCRMIRPRPAPTAARMAISRLRPVARASRRLATLAHAMSSTKPTAPASTHKRVLAPR